MNTFNSYLEQFNDWRKQASIQNQLAIGVAAIACVIAIIGVGIWSSQPTYVSFLQDVAPEDMAKVVAKLDAGNIKYQLSFSGKDVLVDKSKWNLANIAAGDLAPGTSAEPKMAPDSILDSPAGRGFRETQYKEKRLAANLAKVEGIQAANVHLSVAKESPFARERQASTASVILTLRKGYTLSRQKSQSLISIVASADKSLMPENVQLLDDKGNIYSSSNADNAMSGGGNYEMQRQLEGDKSSAAQAMLDYILGPGKAIVKVSAQLTTEKNTLTTESFDPDAQAKISEEKNTVTTRDPQRLSKGTTGTSGNISSRGFSGDNGNQLFTSESETTHYLNSKKFSTIVSLPGEITRLTVAVTYDPWVLKKVTAPNADGAPVATDSEENSDTEKDKASEDAFEELPITDEQVEAMVKQAIGFDPDRGDEITVVRAKLAESEFASLFEEEPADFLATYGHLARHTSLGIAAILAFLFGTMTLKKLKPVTIVKPSSTEITPERAKQLTEISMLAHENPEILGKIMAAWLNESSDVVESGGAAVVRRAA